MIALRRLALGITVLALSSCSSSPTTPTANGGVPPTVRGRVVDYQSGQPVAGAVVGFAVSFQSGGPAGLTQTAVTDSNGFYALPEPSPPGDEFGYHQFIVNNQSWGRGYPRAANNRAGDVLVNTGACVSRYGMMLDRQTYRPIVGVEVIAIGGAMVAKSDSDGWYEARLGCSGSTGFNTTWLTAKQPQYNELIFATGRGISGAFREDLILSHK